MKAGELRSFLSDVPDDADILLVYDDDTEYYATSMKKCYVAKIERKDRTAFLSVAENPRYFSSPSVVADYENWKCRIISINQAVVIS